MFTVMGVESREALHAAILDDLAGRSRWDDRQAMFYRMRHNGLRRKNKPWPGASDAHYPLTDTIIERLKPFFFQQLFATDLIATFTPVEGSASRFTTAAAQWFDHKLKQQSNLEQEVLSVIDSMLMGGRGVMKITWDMGRGRLRYESVDPQNLIVPASTRDIADADRIVHVQRYTLDAYRREKRFNQDPGFIKLITGEAGDRRGDLAKAQAQYQREGLTHSEDGTVVVWEVWCRNEKGYWYCQTYSPLQPEQDVRESFELPYRHGRPPFTAFSYEIKDQRWYSPRGVTEMVAVHEAELCKLMNEKNDYMTYVNRPLFRTSRDIPNAANLKFTPGQILPYDVQPVSMPQPPVSFDQSMLMVRDIAEQRVATPDFGLSQTFNVKERRTATEINAIGDLFHQSSDLRLRIFRMGLNSMYQMSWDLLVQYGGDDLSFWITNRIDELPVEALQENFTIQPTGSADGVNRQFIYNRAVGRMQMFAGDPYVDQGELRKSVLEADDAALAKRLFVDPELKMADQAEDQANEITFLKLGFPAVVKQSDDHAAHIRTILGYMGMSMQLGRQPEPIEMQRLQEHVAQHLEALRQQDPKMAKEVEQEIAEIAAASAAATQQQQSQGDQAVEAMPAEGEVLNAA
tara:strand:+ start:1973 stop:3865 length:1893 start_codon:yes stop_codon:yes gene_type:complete